MLLEPIPWELLENFRYFSVIIEMTQSACPSLCGWNCTLQSFFRLSLSGVGDGCGRCLHDWEWGGFLHSGWGLVHSVWVDDLTGDAAKECQLKFRSVG